MRFGHTWDQFLELVRALPEGQLWRHNEAGDLPGDGEDIDEVAFWRLVEANRGRSGFTFTHKDPRPSFVRACEEGFTVNLSCDSLEEADRKHAKFPQLPLSVVVPRDEPRRNFRTPAGLHVVVCPAQTVGLTCAQCRLCGQPHRRSVVAFKAHGSSVVTVDQLVRRAA